MSRQELAYTFAAPPELPDDRTAALRTAFDRTMKDPEFLAEARTADLDVRPVAGAAVEALIKEIYVSPPEAIKMATEALQAKP
jgi:tripartite-type tricarboxylate transporter receptor subunit TctC